MIRNKRQDIKIINAAIKASFKGLEVNQAEVKRIVKLLNSYPEARAIQMLNLYLKRLKNVLDQTHLSIESATKLTPSELKLITDKVKTKQPVTEVDYQINPSLIGGFKVKIGDKLIDSSVNRQINDIGEAIYG